MVPNPSRPLDGNAPGAPDWLEASNAAKAALKPIDRVMALAGAPGCTPREQQVLMLLGCFDGPGGCFPLRQRIADALGIEHEQNVSPIFTNLERKGRLFRVPRARSTLYILRYDDLPLPSANRRRYEDAGAVCNPQTAQPESRLQIDRPAVCNPQTGAVCNPQTLNGTEREEEREAASAAPLSPQAGRGGARRADLADGNREGERAAPLPAGRASSGAARGNAEERERRQRDRAPVDEYDRRDPDRREHDARAERGETSPAEALQYQIDRTRELLATYERADMADRAEAQRQTLDRLLGKQERLGKGGRGASETESKPEIPNA